MEEKLLAAHKKIFNGSEILLAIAYLSLAIISSYSSFFAFDVSFPGILVFIICVSAAAIYGLDEIQDFRLPFVGLLLLLRLFLFTVNTLFIAVERETLFEQVVTTFCAILILAICENQELSVKNTLTPFLILTDIQLFYSVASKGFNLGKAEITAGIGNSNYAATFLLLCVAYLFFTDKEIFDKIVLCVSVVALLITQSFACYFALVVIIAVWAFEKIDWKSSASLKKAGIIALAGIFCIVCFFASKIGRPVYQLICTKMEYLFQGNLKNFSSSRTELYAFSFSNIKKHILFGAINNVDTAHALNCRFQGYRTHNFVLESLLLYGIVGSLINAAILYIFFKECKGKKKHALLMSFIAVLVHGLFEPNFFTMHFEVVIWLIIGCGLRTEKKTDNKGMVTIL